jgi:transcriptional regulator with XRE-family HTH domain
MSRRGRGMYWTESELAVLRRLYPTSKRAVVMAALPGRSVSSMLNQARAMKLEKAGRGRWTIAKDNQLAAIFERAPWPRLVEVFAPHTRGAIEKRATSLGLIRDKATGASPFAVVRELRRIRRARKIEIDKLAQSFGLYGSMLSRWETTPHGPHLKGFLAWVDALGLEIALQRKGLASRQAMPVADLSAKERMMSRNGQRHAPLRAAL